MSKFISLGEAGFENEAEARKWALEEWKANPKDLEWRDILVVGAQYQSYEGAGFFLLRERATGKLYEVHGGHCSCYGFEDQFELDECTFQYLLSDKFSFYDLGGDHVKADFQKFVREVEEETAKDSEGSPT